MTGISRQTRRRRWLAGIGLLLVGSAGMVWWDNHRQLRTQEWFREAEHGHHLMAWIRTVCVIPGIRDHDSLSQVFGRQEITVDVYNAEDANKLLAMPPCPVKLVVETMPSTPPDTVQRLRERFGDAVQ